MAGPFLLLLEEMYKEKAKNLPPKIDYDKLPDDQHPDYDPNFWEGVKNE